MAGSQPVSFANSLEEARQRLAAELRAQAEQIQKIHRELTELHQLQDRTEQEAIRQWDELTRAASLAAAGEARISRETALENVLSAVRAMMTCTMPEQVFAVLTEESSQWGVRAAVFDVRGRAAWGASASGFGPALSEEVLRSLIVPLNKDNPFRQVFETAAHVDTSGEALKRNRNVLDKLQPAPHAPILLLPIRSAGTVAAIFYADPGEKGESLPVNALKILAEFAGAQIDRLIALSGGFATEEAPPEVAEPAESEAAAEEPAAEATAEAPAAPVESTVEEAPPVELAPEPAAPSGQLAAEPPAAEIPAEMPAQAEPHVVELSVDPPVVAGPIMGEVVGEVHTEVAVAELSAPAAEPPAVATEPPAPPSDISAEPAEPVAPIGEGESAPPAPEAQGEAVPPSSPEPASAAASAPALFEISQLSETEQKLHKDAKRFAKLLVSEIELYNKAKVADGRRNRDLYKRLKTDIERSRQTFEKRFGKSLSKEFDYFHDELVRNLAENDSSILGPEYPGPPA